MASKKKSIFPTEIVNEEERRRKHRFIERFVADLPGYIDALNAEGLPTDIKAIDEFADMDEAAYVAHVKKLFKQYLDRIGFCPTDERKRIADNFNAMFERTKDTVACSASTNPKEKAQILLALADLQKWKREDLGDKEKQVLFYIPLPIDKAIEYHARKLAEAFGWDEETESKAVKIMRESPGKL